MPAPATEATASSSPRLSNDNSRKVEVEQDLIILDSSHEESNTSANTSNGLIMGLNKSPQLHARSLMKTPIANHKSQSSVMNMSAGTEADDVCGASSSSGNGSDDHRLDELIKNLAKESVTVHLEEANEKERVETISHHSKLNTLLINIPNNQLAKSTNQGSAKPLAPDQLKCNILKGKSKLFLNVN